MIRYDRAQSRSRSAPAPPSRTRFSTTCTWSLPFAETTCDSSTTGTALSRHPCRRAASPRPSPPRPWSTSRRSAPFDRRRRGGHVVDVPEHPLGSALLCAAAVRPTSTYAPVPSCRAPCAAGPGSRDRHRVVEAQVAIVRHRTHHGVVTGERVRSPSRPGARRACPARLMRTRAGCGGPRGGRALGSIERAATGCVQRKRLGSRVRPPPVEVR